MEARRRTKATRVLGAARLGSALLVLGCVESRELRHSASSECSGCHGNAARPIAAGTSEDAPASILLRAAPPYDVSGHIAADARGVGAHLAHVKASATHSSIDCVTCHEGVTADVATDKYTQYFFDTKHIDGVTAIRLNGVATSNGRQPEYSSNTLSCQSTWCHAPDPGSTSLVAPVWTSRGGALTCHGCHGDPPASPHVQSNNCQLCHGSVVGGSDGHSIVNPSLHVNGMIDTGSLSCNGGCHGSPANAAPPIDLSGSSDIAARGVGAHQAHLNTKLGRAVECGDCHHVPSSLGDPAHIDATPGAEVVFSALASSATSPPNWNGTTCSNVFCHNPTSAAQAVTGGAHNEPVWTQTGQSTCGSCHGLPPPAPHPAVSAGCSGCHSNVTDALGFVDPNLHLNGTVDF